MAYSTWPLKYLAPPRIFSYSGRCGGNPGRPDAESISSGSGRPGRSIHSVSGRFIDSAIVSHYRESHKVEVFFCLKIKPKNRLYHFYPFAKDRREKINELQAMIFDEESANDAQKILAPPKNLFIDFTPIFFLKKNRQNMFVGVQK